MPSYVFVDARVIDINSILAEIAPDVVAVVLDPLQDGLNQIAAVLSGQTAVDAVHILSHGADGTLYLGNGIANQANLAHYSDQLAAIGTALTADGDILLYGCDVAATDYGLAFIEALARASRADVAASTDATGSAILGGDAQLEAATGHIEAIPVLTDENAAGLTQLLAVPTLSGATANLAYTEQAAPIVLSPSITVTDADGMLAGATVRLNGFQPGDLLAATVGVTSINATYNAANGVLVLTGNDTVANYQQVLRSVTFSSSSDNPTNRGLNPTRTVDWQVNDGSALAGPLFGTQTPFVAGTGPVSVAIADLNGDGKLDLAVANQSSNNVSVLLGNGDGTFGAATNFATGTLPASIVIADMNSDGKLDLVVANVGTSRSVSVLLGNGNGMFAATIESGPGAISVAIGDFSSDGKLDRVTTSDGSAVVRLGNGEGSFSSTTYYPVGPQPVSVSIGDLNGDGKLDLAVANISSNDVSVSFGDGYGAFAPATNFLAGTNPRAVTIGDLNGDNKLDLAIANQTSNNVSLLLNDGAGTFATATNLTAGIGPVDVSIADVNGDGRLDVAVANAGGGISVLLGNGDGTFLPKQDFAAGPSLRDVAIADLNNDGRLDFAVANQNNVSILLNAGTNLSNAQHTALTITAANDDPMFTAMAAVVATVRLGAQARITLNNLKAQGNETDDGTVNAFVVKAVTSGSLLIGDSASTATTWVAGSNDRVDATHQAYWTTPASTFGTLNAFTILATDNNGVESGLPAVQVTVAYRAVTTYNWSELANGQLIASFYPDVDVLYFDDITISAADLIVGGDDTTVIPFASISYAGKAVTINMNPFSFAASNIVFANGSVVLIGDNTTSTEDENKGYALTGGAGNDVIAGGGGADSLSGGDGNDVFIMPGTSSAGNFFGNDTIDGGSGIDRLEFSRTNTGVNVNLGGGTAITGDGPPVSNFVLSGIENVYGTQHNDILIGDSGNNLFQGRRGNDAINGGAGFDITSYESASGDVTVNLLTATGTSSGADGVDSLTSIEGIVGSDFSDSLIGNGGANEFRGRAGNDTISGGLGNDAINGGLGYDKANYGGVAGNYTITRNGLTTTVTGPDGTDTLASIELLQFAGGAVRSLDADRDYGYDGKTDILWRNTNGSVAVWQMDGFTQSNGAIVGTATTDWKIADGSGDYDGNGKSDLLWFNDNGFVAIWQMDGLIVAGGLTFSSVSPGWKIADGAGDYNADGKSDILLRHDNGNLGMWLMDGMAIASGLTFSNASADWKIADGAGDYNGDGKSDILWRNANGNVAVWLMDGFTQTAGAIVSSASTDWKIADGSGDYNGDGKSDILFHNDNGNVAIWQMDGVNINDASTFSNTSAGWKIADGSGDHNGDGKSDILLHHANGNVGMWLMDGMVVATGSTISNASADWSIVG